MALAQLASRQQPRLHLDELPFIEKELQQLVQWQVMAATCKSVQTTVPASPKRRYSCAYNDRRSRSGMFMFICVC